MTNPFVRNTKDTSSQGESHGGKVESNMVWDEVSRWSKMQTGEEDLLWRWNKDQAVSKKTRLLGLWSTSHKARAEEEESHERKKDKKEVMILLGNGHVSVLLSAAEADWLWSLHGYWKPSNDTGTDVDLCSMNNGRHQGGTKIVSNYAQEQNAKKQRAKTKNYIPMYLYTTCKKKSEYNVKSCEGWWEHLTGHVFVVCCGGPVGQ